MSEVETTLVEPGLDKVVEMRPDLLPEQIGNMLVFYPSKKKGDLTRSFFALFPREDGNYWVRCRGKVVPSETIAARPSRTSPTNGW